MYSKKGVNLYFIIGLVILLFLAFIVGGIIIQRDIPALGEKVEQIIRTGRVEFFRDPDYTFEPAAGVTLRVASGDIDGDDIEELVILVEDPNMYYLYFFEYDSEKDKITLEDYNYFYDRLTGSNMFKVLCEHNRNMIDLAINKKLEGQDPIYVLRVDGRGDSSEVDDVLKYIVTLSDETCFDSDKIIRVQSLQDSGKDHIAITADDFSYGVVEHKDSLASFATPSEVYTIDAGNLQYPYGKQSSSNVIGFCYLDVGGGTWLDISSGDIDGSGTSSMVYIKNDGFTIYYNSDFACSTDTSSPVSIEGDFIPMEFVGEDTELIAGDVGSLEFKDKEVIYLIDTESTVHIFDGDGFRRKSFAVQSDTYYDIAAWHFNGLDHVALVTGDGDVHVYKVPLASDSTYKQLEEF